MTVRCLDLSFTHHKFPYRLEHGTGTVSLQDDVMQAHLTAYGGNQPVRIDARCSIRCRRPSDGSRSREKTCRWTRSCSPPCPSGPGAVARAAGPPRRRSASSTTSGGNRREEPFHQHLFARVNRCWLRYEQFPYSLANIRGTLTMTDGNWTFHSLEGTNGAARVTCEGA